MVKYLGRNQEVLDVDPEPVGTLHTHTQVFVCKMKSRIAHHKTTQTGGAACIVPSGHCDSD